MELLKSGELAAVRDGGRVKIRVAELDRYIADLLSYEPAQRMTVELVRIPVADAADLMAMHEDGKNWASLRYMCDSLGIDYRHPVTQASRPVMDATVGQRPTVATDGKVRDMADRQQDDSLWLATIDENRNGLDEVRLRLIAYQREPPPPRTPTSTSVPSTSRRLIQFDVLTGCHRPDRRAQREAAEVKAIAAKTEARLTPSKAQAHWFSPSPTRGCERLPTSSDYRRLWVPPHRPFAWRLDRFSTSCTAGSTGPARGWGLAGGYNRHDRRPIATFAASAGSAVRARRRVESRKLDDRITPSCDTAGGRVGSRTC